ncbi:MAG: 50S ribosomal protein L4 [Oscillospiraceae bacterium]|nr:50S ribosomal protein L4 [Oscillospiraceae bacterium]MCL2279970.1 50S ribosomal protein L4 [Oscillospiraceae bacterium]
MPAIKVYDMKGKVVGEVTLSEAVFGIKPNTAAIHAAVKNHLANKRQGTQSSLTRAEVRGGGAKPHRQKGTGRARQGSKSVPHYTHGGVAFAPKPRSYRYSLNKKYKRLALKSALSLKAAGDSIIVVDKLKMKDVKTKDFVKFLDAIGVENKALLVTKEPDNNIVLSARNVPGVTTTFATLLSTYDIMNAKTFIVDKAALPKIEEVYA